MGSVLDCRVPGELAQQSWEHLDMKRCDNEHILNSFRSFIGVSILSLAAIVLKCPSFFYNNLVTYG